MLAFGKAPMSPHPQVQLLYGMVRFVRQPLVDPTGCYSRGIGEKLLKLPRCGKNAQEMQGEMQGA
jgi:hypothetical protein